MADSDDTTTLPFVTRRKVLAGTVATTAALPLQTTDAVAGVPAGNAAADPALSLWQDWKAAYRKTAALCRKQQRLETRLAKTIGFPCAKVYWPDEDLTLTISWPGQINELFDDDPALADLAAQAEADLAAHQARWDAEDERIGYSAAKRDEQEAADREQDLFDSMVRTPATTLAGVAGKLDAVLREGESWEECTDFPWPHLRSALTDLVRLGQALEPGVFMPGSERKEPYPRQYRRDGCSFRLDRSVSGV